ncbi:glycoside hydrolase family 15 protein [Saccharicrinis sp. FJH2]|uniref:glycoside hydrolase family 15 protein n=1 Tax=Saccharicrinis sp. FJH65 TaxID=3344659 RepID=UPI0035F468D9
MDNLNYGIVGNCRSAALISEHASLDWFCLPAFNSSSVFASLLDENKGGTFKIITDDSYAISQKYLKNTNILSTRFDNGENIFEVIDFMPRYKNESSEGYYSPPDIIRFIKHIKGTPEFKVNYNPRLEYAKHPTKTYIHDGYVKSHTLKGTYDSLYLYSDIDFNSILNGETITVTSDAYFLVSYNQKILPQSVQRSYLKLQRTKVYWLNWSERTMLYTNYNDEIIRSALVLKLLSYDKTGAVIAALTTSLPETIGEIRNWDYRFCWIRDASMVIKVMAGLGHMNVAQKYLNFIIDVISDKDDKIQIMYGINGEKKLTETTLDYLDGYAGSKPVRIGNDAYKQKQHDIYGVLMDVIYQQFKLYETSLQNSEELWTITRSILRSVERNWKKPDRGIWEIRNEQRHFTFSKVLCWVAVDRGLKIAKLIKQKEYIKPWEKLRDSIEKDIHKKAWNEEIGAYTQSYGSKELDASTLLMESYGFIDARHPRYISTVKATQNQLVFNGLMYRYRNTDDFGVPSSAFTICTFWLINSLYKIGEKVEAKKIFEELLGHSNHLGLYSEDIDFKTKRLLGNFPQAYSHLALIETAIMLSGEEIHLDTMNEL